MDIDIRGRIVSIIGPNGAGKTTLVRILSTQLTPTKGRVTIFGYDLLREVMKIRKLIACLPQDIRPFLYTVTAKEYVITYLRARGYSKSQALEQCDNVMSHLDIIKYKNTEVGKLSGGTLKKVFLSMILAADVDLYFLDEPTTGLDPVARNRVWAYLHALARKEKRGILLTSHYMDEISVLSDEVIIMNNGKIITRGTPCNLLQNTWGKITNKILIKNPTDDEKRLIERIIRKDPSIYVYSISGMIYLYTPDVSTVEEILRDHHIRYEVAPISLEDVFFRVCRNVS